MMRLISSGINGVRVFDLPTGVWKDGAVVEAPRVCLVKWRSEWKDKLYQVYVNGYFAGATVDCWQREMVVQTPSCYERAARVEVFAVEASEADVDFSDELERGDGDSGRVRLSLLRSQRLPAGARFEVYFDNGTGVVDYEHPIGGGQVWGCWQDKAGFGLAMFGEGDFGYEWAGGVGFGIGGFGLGEFGVDADVIEWVSPALDAGTYRFGVKVIDERGNESAASETGEVVVIPAARPARGLDVLSFEETTNALMLEVEDEK
jgi:hypothetical protein